MNTFRFFLVGNVFISENANLPKITDYYYIKLNVGCDIIIWHQRSRHITSQVHGYLARNFILIFLFNIILFSYVIILLNFFFTVMNVFCIGYGCLS